MKQGQSNEWPILRKYDSGHLDRFALPLGGIGTGTVSLGGRGDLRDWEIMNRPSKGYTPALARGLTPFFAIQVKERGKAARAKVLEGPLPAAEIEGATGCRSPNHGLPRFRDCECAAAYPFGQVFLSDVFFPVDVRLRAFNPLIPNDAGNSGLPVVLLRYEVSNTTDSPLKVSLCGSLPNFVGREIDDSEAGRRNREQIGPGITGVLFDAPKLDPKHEDNGEICLAVLSRKNISLRTSWPRYAWCDSLLDFWDDFLDDGRLRREHDAERAFPMGSLCQSARLAPQSSHTFTFMLAWHFPNRRSWSGIGKADGTVDPPAIIGNYYAERFKTAWEAARYTQTHLHSLEKKTLDFVNTFCSSDLPDEVLEAALFNVSTLRTQTCFRTPDGRFYGFEGCGDQAGCCMGSCTHVWNYEQATAFLFGELALTMRDVEFAHATDKDGRMSFRVHLPLKHATHHGKAAADGQMGCIMKMYRDWQLSGDTNRLKDLWPKVRKALEFCWLPGGWDADQDGVMEGCQHNTMDVEYYGPNPQMGFWYLGALRAAEEMAAFLGDGEFAASCRDLFEKGSAWIGENLFNGEYYEHEIRPAGADAKILDGLNVGMGTRPGEDPVLQLGKGCLVDQLAGQFFAHICGLGYLAPKKQIQRTLRGILKYNRQNGFYDHFNPMRSYVAGDERALLMARYPRGDRPARPFPYFSEVMSGFEYTAAAHMLYEGLTKEGLACIRDIRARYDGRKRSPFDEAECGHHYARAMASWAAVPALTGFSYSAVSGVLSLKDAEGRFFWSTGYAWGEALISGRGSRKKLMLKIKGGRLRIRHIRVGDLAFDMTRGRILRRGAVAIWSLSRKGYSGRG